MVFKFWRLFLFILINFSFLSMLFFFTAYTWIYNRCSCLKTIEIFSKIERSMKIRHGSIFPIFIHVKVQSCKEFVGNFCCTHLIFMDHFIIFLIILLYVIYSNIILIKDLSLGHKIWFSSPYPYVADLRCFKQWILLVQIISVWNINVYPLGCKYIGIKI